MRGTLNASGPFLFQHDRTPVHRASSIKTWRSESGVEELDWPAQSPDLHPIEHLWDGLAWRLRARPSEPASESDLVESRPRRAIAVKGGPTSYSTLWINDGMSLRFMCVRADERTPSKDDPVCAKGAARPGAEQDTWAKDHLTPSWVCLPNGRPVLAIVRPGESALDTLETICKPLRAVSGRVMASRPVAETPSLSRSNGFRCVPPAEAAVEDVLLAVGEKVGHDQIYSASRMNKAVVVFVKDERLVNELVEGGIWVLGNFVPVSPLSTPAARVTISNVPPFIANEPIAKELSRFGKLASGIRLIPLGCKSAALKHVLSFRRQVFMFLNSADKTLEVSFRVSHGESSYMVYASTDSLKCFQCGVVGHKRFECPSMERSTTQGAQASSAADMSGVPDSGVAVGVFKGPGEGSSATSAPGVGRDLGSVSGQQRAGQGGSEFGEQLRGQGEFHESKTSNATLRMEAVKKMVGSVEPGAQVGSVDGAQVGSVDGAQVTSKPGAQVGSVNGAQVTSEPGAQVGSVNGVQVTSEPGAQVGSVNGVQVTSEPGAQVGSVNGAQVTSEVVSEANGGLMAAGVCPADSGARERGVVSDSQLSLAVSLEEDMEEDRMSEVSDFGGSQCSGELLYSVDQINSFLDETKGKSVDIGDFFPDLDRRRTVMWTPCLSGVYGGRANSFLVMARIGADRCELFARLDQLLQSLPTEDTVVLGGDWNCTLDFVKDRNGEEPHPQSARILANVLSGFNLIDVWREKHPAARQYSWLRYAVGELERDIMKIHDLMINQNGSDLRATLAMKLQDLSDLLQEKAKGVLVRSRFISVQDMDAPTAFFFNLEKSSHKQESLVSVRRDDGTVTADPAEVKRLAVDFYSQLFTASAPDQQCSRVLLEDLPQLDEQHLQGLDTALTFEEVTRAVFQLASGRAPGIDGLPADFYKAFWETLGRDLYEVLLASYEAGALPTSCRRAVLSLIPKKGDLCLLTNWRPVSLLCADYKILSRCIANRLREVLGVVVHVDQSYCVPKRSIYDNLFLMRDLFDYAQTFNSDFGFLSLDQEKAFDRVGHDYLFATLRAFGFRDAFVSWVRLLYAGASCLIKVRGGLSLPVEVGRGIRQGCPMSGQLYSIAVEPFLCLVRKRLSGLCVGSSLIKVSAYADDIAVVVRNEQDVASLRDALRTYGSASSAKVNWGKTEALWCGGRDYPLPPLPGGVRWSGAGFKYLGVWLGNNEIKAKNWEGVVEKVRARLSKWSWLLPRLSYRGRVLVLNNLVASALWHKFTVLNPPGQLIMDIQRMLVDFFWSGQHWLRAAVLYLPVQEGGQGLMDIRSRVATLRLQATQRLLYGDHLSWMAVACALLRVAGRLGLDRHLFSLRLETVDLGGLTSFYLATIEAWQLFSFARSIGAGPSLWTFEEPLFFNPAFPSLNQIPGGLRTSLLRNGISKVCHLRRGVDWVSAEQLAEMGGFRSVRLASQVLNWLRSDLSPTVSEYLDVTPVEQCQYGDFGYPDLVMDFTWEDPREGQGLLLSQETPTLGHFSSLHKDSMYRACMKALNFHSLRDVRESKWTGVVQADSSPKGSWRSLYKRPIEKRVGDLQWRIVHGILATNRHAARIDPSVGEGCPFCGVTETIFHVFLQCGRLGPTLGVVRDWGLKFLGFYDEPLFIYGPKYSVSRRDRVVLLNFLYGAVKLAIWLSRRNRIRGCGGIDPVQMARGLIMKRLLVEFTYYTLAHGLDSTKHYLRLKFLIETQVQFYIPKPEEDVHDLTNPDCTTLPSQLYKEIELCSKIRKVIQFDRDESCMIGYGFSISVVEDDSVQQLYITDVKAGGLAFAKGLNAGDEILQLNGKNSSTLTFSDMKAAFSQASLSLTVNTLPPVDRRQHCFLPPRRSDSVQHLYTDIFSQNQEEILDDGVGLISETSGDSLDDDAELFSEYEDYRKRRGREREGEQSDEAESEEGEGGDSLSPPRTDTPPEFSLRSWSSCFFSPSR
ncbi:hypothetical protein NFI96_009402 [Prochilodus magdalenae]|nr:hypothetical protein NFI96_009402 [Prochilodus magdalenae]